MESLYNSLYDSLGDDGNNNSDLFNIIEKFSGNHDINAQSRYFNIEEYTLATNSYLNN